MDQETYRAADANNANSKSVVSMDKAAVLAFFFCAVALATEVRGEAMRFYCGTYTTRLGHVSGTAQGIRIYELEGDSGQITLLGKSSAIDNTSHLCLGIQEKFLYSISEITSYKNQRDGCLTTFGVAKDPARLKQVQRTSSSGPGPAYVSLDQTGRFLLLANYVAGNIVIYPILSNGLLGEPTANVMHVGSSINPRRQEGPHPHAIVASPDNRFVFVPDLGIDRIMAYRFDAQTGQLKKAADLDVVLPRGSGPRHFVFSPDGRYAYCSLELTSQVATFGYRNGRLVRTGIEPTLPDDFSGESTNAEVRISPDGKYVYVSNRGHDSIAVFAAGDGDGKLKLVETVSTAGKTPRNFGISPDGNWIVAANQDSHSLVVFSRNSDTGKLEVVGDPIECPSPALICFAEAL